MRNEGLANDAGEVLRTLERKEMQVESKSGAWYLMRMLPYRTADNVIEGVVITFIDISETKAAEAAAAAERNAQALLQSTFDAFQVPALVLDGKLRVVKVNPAFCRAFATNVKKTEDPLIYDIGGGERDIPKLRELLEEVIPREKTIDDFEVTAKSPKIGERTVRLNARRLERETGLPGMILLTMAEA
jgi:two-component system, chemotaxis family, CheB/CheR fusion protein